MTTSSEVQQKRQEVEGILLDAIAEAAPGARSRSGGTMEVLRLAEAFALVHSGKPAGLDNITVQSK